MSIDRLRRNLDLDLIARMKAGNVHKHEPAKRVTPPRKADTYRAARRNQTLRKIGTIWRGAKPTGTDYRPPVRANRSRKWAPINGRLYHPGAR